MYYFSSFDCFIFRMNAICKNIKNAHVLAICIQPYIQYWRNIRIFMLCNFQNLIFSRFLCFIRNLWKNEEKTWHKNSKIPFFFEFVEVFHSRWTYTCQSNLDFSTFGIIFFNSYRLLTRENVFNATSSRQFFLISSTHHIQHILIYTTWCHTFLHK